MSTVRPLQLSFAAALAAILACGPGLVICTTADGAAHVETAHVTGHADHEHGAADAHGDSDCGPDAHHEHDLVSDAHTGHDDGLMPCGHDCTDQDLASAQATSAGATLAILPTTVVALLPWPASTPPSRRSQPAFTAQVLSRLAAVVIQT